MLRGWGKGGKGWKGLNPGACGCRVSRASYPASRGKIRWLQLCFFPVAVNSLVSVSRQVGTLVRGAQHSQAEKEFSKRQTRTVELPATSPAPEASEININSPWPHPGSAVSVGGKPRFGSWHFWLPAIRQGAISLPSLNCIS